MSLTTLRVTAPAEVLSAETLAAIPTEVLAGWLATRRWYAAKGAVPRRAQITRVVPLPWEQGHFAIAELVTESDAGTARWQLPLAVVADANQEGALLQVDVAGTPAALVDATTDSTFLRRLADTFAQHTDDPTRFGASVSHDDVTWAVETLGHEAFVVPVDASIRVASVEQSNTSVLFGDRAILKLFRRLEAGEHPDVEVTRFLTGPAGFPHTPTLLGTIRFDEGASSTIVGMLQEYLPDSVDAWRWTLSEAASYFGGGGRGVSGVGSGGKATPNAPRSTPNPYTAAAERLGVVTRAMHEALASDAAESDPAFAPEPAEIDDVERWAEGTRTEVREALDLLERQLAAGHVPKERAAEARALAGRRDAFLAEIDELEDAIAEDAGSLVRHHGDYHLGQVLRTKGGDFVVIDFEGEPSRPLTARRRKHSALRDVAGMLRSFAYAAATLATEAGAALAPAERETRAGRWEREARDAFLRGYLRAPVPIGAEAPTIQDEEPGFLPEDPENVKRLITLFELEKVFYELVYELNNRPTWLWIPLRGASRLLA